MNNIKILNKKETQEISEKLKNQFGIMQIPGILLRKGKERIFLFQGEATENEIKKIDSITNIERAGIYIGKIFEPTDEIRLSIEGTQIFKNQITRNIFILDKKEDYEKPKIEIEIIKKIPQQIFQTNL